MRNNQICPVARYTALFGDAWTWMIIRETFGGVGRFSQIQRNTGIAKNLLSRRLRRLVEAGILKRTNMSRTGLRFEYQLTEKGESLSPVLKSIVDWSEANLFEGHPANSKGNQE